MIIHDEGFCKGSCFNMDGRLYAYICHACILISVYFNSGAINAEFRHYPALWYLLIYRGEIPRSATLKAVFHFKAESKMITQHFICFGYLALTDASSYLSGTYDLAAHTIADKPNAQDIGDITGEVKFDDVTFSYEQGKTVLEHISFDVKPGESVALVGPTGAGKSTVVSLLSRFYDLDSGKITIDGKDISQATLHSLRSQMGIMLQDSFIFSGTIYDNIRYGRLDATEEEIREAAKIVCADEFISEMKDGYMTEVNERGSKLSGGQKQLISFARTLLSDPKILVLDEATSSIDARTEKLLQQGLQRLLVGRTSFIIAHRLSTIKNCDKIMYIDNKGIAECGTHDQLIAKKGEYYKLYTAQHMD